MEDLRDKKNGLISVLALVALMLAVAYYGGGVGRLASTVFVPSVRVSLDDPGGPARPEENIEPEAPLPPSEGFGAYRETVWKSRETAAMLLDEVIANTAASADTVQEALRQKAELARAVELEAACEALLHARGFEDAICSVQRGGVNILVRGQALSQQQAAQILDIAISATGEPASRIRIVPRE